MNNTIKNEAFEELQRITKLLVLIATKDQSQKEKIETLNSIGFQPKKIAELIGTTANSVNVSLANTRKKIKQKKEKTKNTSVD